jgi:hypothetical protein
MVMSQARKAAVLFKQACTAEACAASISHRRAVRLLCVQGNCFGSDLPPERRQAVPRASSGSGYGGTGHQQQQQHNQRQSVDAAEASRRRKERAAAAETRVRGSKASGKSSTAGGGRSSALGEDHLLYGDINANRKQPMDVSPGVNGQDRAKSQWEKENRGAIGATILNTRGDG